MSKDLKTSKNFKSENGKIKKIEKEEEEKEIVVESEEADDMVLKLKKLREELKKCQKEKEEYLRGWQRAKADFINARKDEERQRKELIKFSNQVLISDILVVLDSFDLALNDLERNVDLKDSGLFKGFYLIKSQLDDVLKKYGLKPIEAVGQKFNPELHEAVAEVDDSHFESGIVVEEVQRGYLMFDKVLRPARVKVAK